MIGSGAGDRTRPNILVTGTPGTGKTSFASRVEEELGFTFVNVGDLVKAHGFHGGRDSEFDTLVLDEDAEDRLLDHLEPIMEPGGVIVEHHSPNLFPERFFDLVLVLRASTTKVFDRLAARGYTEKKVTENVECEIMQVVLEEARESYDERIVQELPSNEIEDLDSNLVRVQVWLKAWQDSHK